MTKSILITGCSSGIGLAAARTLRERGYRVFASCRKQADVDRLQNEGFSDALRLDLTSSDSIQAAVEQVLDRASGQVFALFNNGAYGLPGAVEDLSRAALRRQFETNVFGTHELTCRLLPTLLQQADARIVQNSSVLGLVAMMNRGAYVASKFALEGLTDALRLELYGTSVKVVLIEPGPILSDFRKNALAEFQREITVDSSRHQTLYRAALERLSKKGPAAPFTLPASAVVDKLILALENPSPRPRYYVTKPTYLMGAAKRLLSTTGLDRVIRRLGSA
jgi:NAD(P)-dependent dehydrogenase (short-subunit alcohol dehydrogenase family)